MIAPTTTSPSRIRRVTALNACSSETRWSGFMESAGRAKRSRVHDRLDQSFVAHAGRGGRLRNEAQLGEPRNRVHLEAVRLALGAQTEIDARDPSHAKRAARAERELVEALVRLVGDRG